MKIIKDMSFNDYKKIQAVNNSSLQSLRRSYNQYLHDRLNPRKDTDSFKLGRAFHSFVLESEIFFDEYCISPDVNKRTKAGKEELAKFQALHKGKELIQPSDFNMISRMRASLMDNSVAQELIINSDKEVTVIGELEGVKCKARADMLLDTYVIDLKTTIDCSKKGFIQAAYKYGYLRQAAFYCDLFNKPDFIFIVQEKSRPHEFNIYQLEETEIKLGRQEYQTYLRYLKRVNDNQHRRVNFFSKKIELLEFPNWVHAASHELFEDYLDLE